MPYVRWTYTLTNADYDAAVARGPMKEQYNHTGATYLQARNPAGEYFPAGFLQETLPKPFAFSKNIPTFVAVSYTHLASKPGTTPQLSGRTILRRKQRQLRKEDDKKRRRNLCATA